MGLSGTRRQTRPVPLKSKRYSPQRRAERRVDVARSTSPSLQGHSGLIRREFCNTSETQFTHHRPLWQIFQFRDVHVQGNENSSCCAGVVKLPLKTAYNFRGMNGVVSPSRIC